MSRLKLSATLALAFLLGCAACEPAHAEEALGRAYLREQIPPPPPPPAWPGVAAPGTQAPTPRPTSEQAPTLRRAAPLALPTAPPPAAQALTPPRRCPPTPDCGLRRDACCWPLDPCGERYPRFTIRIEGLLTSIPSPDGALGGIETGLPNAMDWSALYYGDDLLESVRGRVTLAYALSPTQRLALRGGWLGSWSSEAAGAGVFAFFPGPAGMGGVSTPNTATLTSEADLYAASLMYWDELACTGPWRFEWGLGAAGVRFAESASARDWGATFPGFNAPAFVGSEVENTYLAGQLGFQTHVSLSESFEVSILVAGRAGAMRSEAEVNDRAFFAPGEHMRSAEDTRLALGGLLEIGTRWRLNRSLALTAGYSLMLTDRVVRAYDAMDFTQSNTGAVGAALRSDLLVSHSVFVGFELGF